MLPSTARDQSHVSVIAWRLAVSAITLLYWLTSVQQAHATAAMIEAGRAIVMGNTAVSACADCHGVLGQGDREKNHPRLAGQSRFYLRKQLEDFAMETRPSEDMQPIAEALTAEQREAVAAYYASVPKAPYPPQPQGDPLLLQRGGVLSAVGVPERGIRACALCHADAGAGIPPSFPYLAGQFANYTARQLRLWKQGLRRNDPLQVMANIARLLSDEEIRGLALYFARVRLAPEAINDLTPAAP